MPDRAPAGERLSPSVDTSERIFESTADRRLRGYLSLAGGLALVLVAAGGFALSLRGHPGALAFHASTTLPMILAVGLFATARATLRAPTRVTLTDADLAVHRGRTEIGRWPWDQLTLADTANVAVSGKRVLKLRGPTGQLLATLTDDLADFDALTAAIKLRMAAQPSPQRATVATRKARRQGISLMVGAVCFFALAIANAYMARNDLRKTQLLTSRGQDATATLVRKFTAPDGHTRRIEYRVDAPSAPLENVEVHPTLWPLFRDGQTIPVTAVPSHPEYSRLRIGQIDDKMTADPRLMLLISAVMAVMSIICFVAGLLSVRGLQLKWDAQRSRPTLTRIVDA